MPFYRMDSGVPHIAGVMKNPSSTALRDRLLWGTGDEGYRPAVWTIPEAAVAGALQSAGSRLAAAGGIVASPRNNGVRLRSSLTSPRCVHGWGPCRRCFVKQNTHTTMALPNKSATGTVVAKWHRHAAQTPEIAGGAFVCDSLVFCAAIS